jgi:hypothetical protein
MHDITISSYATRWYITLFTGGIVNYHTLLRIWDVLHMCGFDVLYYVALALLKTIQSRFQGPWFFSDLAYSLHLLTILLALSEKILEGDFESNMVLLSSIIPIENDDKFMKLVRKYYERSVESGTIKKLRQEYISS